MGYLEDLGGPEALRSHEIANTAILQVIIAFSAYDRVSYFGQEDRSSACVLCLGLLAGD